jgi:hypothetical protein
MIRLPSISRLRQFLRYDDESGKLFQSTERTASVGPTIRLGRSVFDQSGKSSWQKFALTANDEALEGSQHFRKQSPLEKRLKRSLDSMKTTDDKITLAPQAGDNAEEPVAWRYRYKGGKWAVQKNKPHWYREGMADVEIEPLYTHPCTSIPVVSQNAPALEDKGGDGWQPIETAPKDRPILLDFSYYYDTDRTPTIIYAVGEYVESDNDYVWDSGDEVHHKDAPRAWMDIPKTNIRREPGFDGKRLKIRRPSR